DSDRLDAYLSYVTPDEAVRTLVFESQPRLEAAFASLRWGRFVVPTNPQDENRLVDRILWKLGLNVASFPTILPTFWSRLETLRTLAQELPEPYQETEREALRGPGTNVFVAVEELLDAAACYSAWALLHDHWDEPMTSRFLYTPNRARKYAT